MVTKMHNHTINRIALVNKVIRKTVKDGRIRQLQQDCKCSFTDGGCFAFASALKSVFGGKLWAVAFKQEEFDKPWATEHALVKINGVLFDATGSMSEQEALKFGIRSSKDKKKIGAVKGWESLWYPTTDLAMDLREAKVISKVMRKYLAIKT